MQALVHSAAVQDRDGGAWLLSTLLGRFPYLEKLFADSAYQGPIFAAQVSKILSRVQVEIVKRSDHAKGFVPLPKRWIVERTIAWLNRCRRLAKDWENLNLTALMFLRFASIRLMLRRRTLARSPCSTQRLPRPRLGDASRNGGASRSQAAQGQLLPDPGL